MEFLSAVEEEKQEDEDEEGDDEEEEEEEEGIVVILITSLSVRYFKAEFHSLRNFLSRIIRLSLLSLKKEKEKKDIEKK